MSEVKKSDQGGLRLLLDYGPLLVFFGVYKYVAPNDPNIVGTLKAIFASTGAFMVAIVVAIVVSKWKIGRVSPMMWLTSILVFVFGGLTLYFHNPSFIQMKPTVIYVLLSGALFSGILMKKPLLKYVFEAGFEGLSAEGWMKLSRNWAWFFLSLAIANHIMMTLYPATSETAPDFQRNWEIWLNFKIWGVVTASFLFAAANVPMLLKHGLGDETAEPSAE